MVLISPSLNRKGIRGEQSVKCKQSHPAAFARFCTEMVRLLVGSVSWSLRVSLPTPTPHCVMDSPSSCGVLILTDKQTLAG